MSQLTDRLRYVNRVVGSFMVMVLVLIVVGLILWIRRSEVFTTSVNVPARIEADDRDGIRVGTEVYFHGEKVGEVARIEPEAGQETQLLRLELKHAVEQVLDRDPSLNEVEYSRFVVMLRHRLGGVGEPYLDILHVTADHQHLAERDPAVLHVFPEPTPAGEVARSIENAQKNLAGAEVSFDLIQKDFALIRQEIQALQKSLHENVTQTRLEIEQIRKNTDELRASATTNFEKFGTGSEKLGTSGEKMEAEFKLTNQEMRAALTKLVAEFEKVGKGAEALEKNSLSMADDFKAASTQLQASLVKLEEEFAKVGKGAETLEQSSQSMDEQFRASSTQLRDTLVKLEAEFAKVGQGAQAVEKSTVSMDEQFKATSVKLQVTLAALETEFAKIGRGAQSVEKSTLSMEQQFKLTNEELRTTLASMEKDFEKFGQGSETLGKSSQAIERQFAQTNAQMQRVLVDLQKASPELEPLISQTRRVMDNMLEITRVVNQEAKDLPGTVRKTQATLDQTQQLIHAIEQNPLIKAHSSKPVSTPLVSPSRVGP